MHFISRISLLNIKHTNMCGLLRKFLQGSISRTKSTLDIRKERIFLSFCVPFLFFLPLFLLNKGDPRKEKERQFFSFQNLSIAVVGSENEFSSQEKRFSQFVVLLLVRKSKRESFFLFFRLLNPSQERKKKRLGCQRREIPLLSVLPTFSSPQDTRR